MGILRLDKRSVVVVVSTLVSFFPSEGLYLGSIALAYAGVTVFFVYNS